MRILFAILILVVSCKSSNTHRGKSTDNLYTELVNRSFYKYSNTSELIIAKEYLGKEYDNKVVPIIFDKKFEESISKRYYHIDGEYLSDKGGINRFLVNQLRPYYNASGLNIQVTNIAETIEDGFAEYSFTVNNKKYNLSSRNQSKCSSVWRSLPFELCKLLNYELETQNLNDRMYLIHADNDCSAIFLTKEQYSFIFDLVEDKWWKPYRCEVWKQLFCES